jgi:hypothetical protein
VVQAPGAGTQVLGPWQRNSLTAQALVLAEMRIPPRWFACTLLMRADSCYAAWTQSRVVQWLYGREGLQRATDHMSRLAALLRTRGIPLTVVVYPWPHHLLWEDRQSLHVSHWQAWAAREDAGFVELFTPFFAQVDALGARETIRRFFIDADVHWNASGHRIVADAFERAYEVPRRTAD